MLTSKLEVLVELGPKPETKTVDDTLKVLKSQDGIKEAIFKDGAFMIETTLPSAVVLDMVTKTSGKRAVLQGFGDGQSAVAMISSHPCGNPRGLVLGSVRLQRAAAGLVCDGAVHGLAPGPHGLHLHRAGDLTQGCDSLGEHYNPHGSPHGGPDDPPSLRHAGDLGNIVADEEGRATFRIENSELEVWDLIGRSLAVTERRDDLGRGTAPRSKIDGDSGRPIACGIIARSAGIFQNPKRICACDGVVVWDERDKPLAGKGRRCCGKHEEKESGVDGTGDKKSCCKA